MAHAVQKSEANVPLATQLGVCGECGAPHHDDQRYCLSCGGSLHGSPPSGPPAHLLAGSPSHRPTQGDGSAPTVIAGVGVLLLAMGVGVLIGRTGNSAPASTGAPQVVTVSAPTTGTTSNESESSESTSGSNRKGHSAGKHHGKSGGSSSNGVGSSIEKPAPPSVVTNLHKSGGGSYEKKSKELPNVISTG